MRFQALVLIVFLAVASTDPAPGSLFYLAPQTQIRPAQKIKIGKSSILWTAQAIYNRFRNGGRRRQFENALLDFLNKKRYTSDEEFHQISAPFETFLLNDYGGYFFSWCYYLLWKNAPSLEEQERFLNLILDQVSILREDRHFEHVFRSILIKIIQEDLVLSTAILNRLENIVPGFSVLYSGMISGSEYLLWHISRSIQNFRDNLSSRTKPDRNLSRYLLGGVRWDTGNPAMSSSLPASEVLALADQLFSALETMPRAAPSQPNLSRPQPDARSQLFSKLRREAMTRYGELKMELKPLNGKTSFTLKCGLKRPRSLKVEVHFKSKEDGRAFQSSVSNLRKRISEFMIEINQRRILVEFVYPIEIGRVIPPFLKLTFKNRHGALVEEYLDFCSEGTFKFEEKPLALNGSRAIQWEQNTIRVHLPELAKLLGARSRVLSYFYLQGPDESVKLCEIDGKDSVENSI